VAATIATAVFDTVGVRIRDVPLTAEQVFVALQARRGGEVRHCESVAYHPSLGRTAWVLASLQMPVTPAHTFRYHGLMNTVRCSDTTRPSLPRARARAEARSVTHDHTASL
jgi:hypothetical protein